jgi:type IV secretion system protein VirB4
VGGAGTGRAFRSPPAVRQDRRLDPVPVFLHVGDVGHTLVVGPTGAGKSVLLALMALQFRRYAGAQVFAFDFGGSIRAAALAMGGDWHDLGGDLTEAWTLVSLQPLARITTRRARLGGRLDRRDPDPRRHRDHARGEGALWTALTSLASAPVEERTITGLRPAAIQRPEAGAATYCVGGPMGGCSTPRPNISARHRCRRSRSRACRHRRGPAVLAYLFHRIGDRLDGSPTLLIIDEGWLALDDEGFAGQLREWLKTLRKKNASVIFATQSLSDIDGSNIAPGHHRELPDAAAPAERTRDRAADHRDLSALRPQRPPDRDPRAGQSATITASRGAAIACSSWACPRSASRSRRLVQDRPDRDRAHRRRAWPRGLSPPGCACAAPSGPPTSSPTSRTSPPAVREGVMTMNTLRSRPRAVARGLHPGDAARRIADADRATRNSASADRL